MAEAATSLDERRRAQLFAQLQEIGMRDLPYVPIVFTKTSTAVRDDVQNFNTLMTGWWRLEQVWKTSGS